jgi:DNA invertase Pin-like site-specific DNA recombinase
MLYICEKEMIMKAIGILRVSTEAQQIEGQREELHEFIKNHGYEEIIFIAKMLWLMS